MLGQVAEADLLEKLGETRVVMIPETPGYGHQVEEVGITIAHRSL
jgi:hypothetical protein